MSKPSICLNMIVKNEAHVIERCLASAKPLVDYWCIVDTGSTDGTQDTIRRFMAGVPGTLHERPWKNFAHNRSEALELARTEGGDYLLFIDADETFQAPSDFAWPALSDAAYDLTVHYDRMRYARMALVATRLPWRWCGVLHEYLDCGVAVRATALIAPTIFVRHDGARAQDPTTYLKDIALLESALRDEPTNARYVFYLAQSYRDAGRIEDARRTYERRATMGGWDEEIWYALFQMAVLTERLGDAPDRVSAAYLRAFQARPSRAEPIVELARFHRLRGEHALAFLYAKHASEIPASTDRLFVDGAAYAWRALDEMGVSGFYVGTTEARAQGAKATQRILAERVAPAEDLARIEANAKFYG
jgi:tetratricopeptide (TPR) repeat protein